MTRQAEFDRRVERILDEAMWRVIEAAEQFEIAADDDGSLYWDPHHARAYLCGMLCGELIDAVELWPRSVLRQAREFAERIVAIAARGELQ